MEKRMDERTKGVLRLLMGCGYRLLWLEVFRALLPEEFEFYMSILTTFEDNVAYGE